jgi:hypothetical protein
METIEKQPKVFISYSWDGQARQDQVVELVQRLASDGVDTIVDIYDLKEGDDKYHFMEKMVTDVTVSHVLILCDKKYSEKANDRQAGVGTESQIISQEIYSQVSQSKFIPLIYEFNDENEAYTPVFFKSRIYIDFSSPEKENENWERLIRLLYGKPELIKPEVSKRPSYLDVKQTKNTYEMDSKFRTFKNALLSEKITLSLYRDDLLDSCFNFADSLRVRTALNRDDFPQKVIDDFKQLVNVRNTLIDWCLLESRFDNPDFSENLLTVLTRLLEMASRPREVNSWSDDDFHAHKAFAYETFLYILAALIKNEKFLLAHEVLTTHFELPETSLSNDYQFCGFNEFYFSSELLQSKLSPTNMRLYSPVGELLKINAERQDLIFSDIMQADLIATLMSLITNGRYWYPQTLYYANFSQKYPFFIRATQHKHFKKLLELTGYKNAETLKSAITENIERSKREYAVGGGFRGVSYPKVFNMDRWDTLS